MEKMKRIALLSHSMTRLHPSRHPACNVSREELENAAYSACKAHMKKAAVKSMLEDWDELIDLLLQSIRDGTYQEHLHYRQLVKVNKNGKERTIDSPSLVTRILQYLFIARIFPLYEARDNKAALNCKEGCGLNAIDRHNSVRHRVKHLFYDRRDIVALAVIDQRKCYEHVRTSVFRHALKSLTHDKWLVDFGCNVTMVDGKLPIGTPISPLAHHIIMLRFDLDMSTEYPFYLRYADNIMIGCYSKREAQAALWRVKQRWWYEMQIRANRWDSKVIPIGSSFIDFCGTLYRRNPDKGYFDHNKGYAIIRRGTAKSARAANNKNWPCYFGQMKGIDTFNLMTSIESNMKLSKLTEKIRINRKMDAPQIMPKELAGRVITVLDYEIRQNNKGVDNWVKLLLSMEELSAEGTPTGRVLVREMHGDYAGIYTYLRQVEKVYGKANILPIEEAEIVNQCGYIFKGSTNQMQYYEDYATSYSTE